jgi:hypothetical protein
MTTRAVALSRVLSLSKPVLSPVEGDRRIASLYQDKEVRKKSKIYEENTFDDSVLEICGFYNCEPNPEL